MAKGTSAAATAAVPVAGNDTVKAVTYLVAGLFIFSFQDIIVKLLSSTFPVHQLVVIRGLIAAPLIFLYVHYDSGFRTLSVERVIRWMPKTATRATSTRVVTRLFSIFWKSML